MTIGIAVRYLDGAIVRSDRKIVFMDGSTTRENKISVAIPGWAKRKIVFASAYAGADADAAKMLADEVATIACEYADTAQFAGRAKKAMSSWYGSYGFHEPPGVEIIVAWVQAEPDYPAQLLVLRPPSTILRPHDIALIGSGARPLYAQAGIFSPSPNGPPGARETLLRLAYMMYIARRDEGAYVGEGIEAAVISRRGDSPSLATRNSPLPKSLRKRLTMR